MLAQQIHSNSQGYEQALPLDLRLGTGLRPCASRPCVIKHLIHQPPAGIHTSDACGLFWGPPLKKVGQKLVEFLHGADIAGFNQIGYDVPLWLVECKRHGIAFDLGDKKQVDVRVIFNAKEPTWDRFTMGPRNLSAAVRHFCGRELTNAHSAEADCQATADVLLAQLARYPDLPRDVAGLHEFCNKNNREASDEARNAQKPGSAFA